MKLERPGVGTLPSVDAAGRVGLEAEWETLSISAGRKDKMRPGDILGALTGEAGGLSASEVGKIEIQDRIAYVAVAKHVVRVALQRLSDGRIKGRKYRIAWVR